MSKRAAMRYPIQIKVEFTPLPKERISAYWAGFKALMELLREENRNEPGDLDIELPEPDRTSSPGVRS